jgi:hypothetical protein
MSVKPIDSFQCESKLNFCECEILSKVVLCIKHQQTEDRARECNKLSTSYFADLTHASAAFSGLLACM